MNRTSFANPGSKQFLPTVEGWFSRMSLSEAQPSVVCLAFAKERDSQCLHDFEKQIVFGISQRLKYYSPVLFAECVSIPNRISLDENLDSVDQAVRLHSVADKMGCKTIMYGAFTPVNDAQGFLERIDIRIMLYNPKVRRHMFMLEYSFKKFDETRSTVDRFSADWEALCDLMTWLSCQIVGALHPEEALDYWHKIQNLYIAKDYQSFQKFMKAMFDFSEDSQQREALLVSLVTKDPLFFAAQLELANLYKRKKSYLAALQALQSAWSRMDNVMPPQRASCANEIGVCRSLLGSPEDACRWWQISIEADKTYVRAYLNMAHAMEETEKLREAENYFKMITQVAPYDKRAYENLARLYSKMELWEKAIRQYEQQLQYEPDNAWTYCNMANCYLQIEGIDQAKAYLVKTLALDPEGEAGRFANFVLSGLQAAEV